jgi:hypothetical protein
VTGPNEPHDLIHQVVFGWVQRGTGHEMGVYASSYPAGSPWPDRWWDRLDRYGRLIPSQTDSGSYLPESTLTYLTFEDGLAALLRRTPLGSLGRNFSHALVGPADVIERFALAIDEWPFWFDRTRQRQLIALSPQELADTLGSAVAREPDPAIREWVQAVQDQLDLQPGRPVTVVGLYPWHALPVLCRLIDPYRHGPYVGTFATYEASDTDESPDDPAIVFVPVLPGAGTTARARVFPLESVPEELHFIPSEPVRQSVPMGELLPAVVHAPVASGDTPSTPDPADADTRPGWLPRQPSHAVQRTRRKLTPVMVVTLVLVFLAGLLIGQLLSGPSIPALPSIPPAAQPVAPAPYCVAPHPAGIYVR